MKLNSFLLDIKEALAITPVWMEMARQDLVSKYRRSKLGPWWITIGTGVGLIGTAFVWSTLFNMPLKKAFPHITIGFVFWGFISATLIEGSGVFVTAHTIKTIKIPILTFVFCLVLKNIYMLMHTAILIFLVMVAFQVDLSVTMLLFIPGLVLLILTAILVTMVLGLIGARFRDLSYTVASFMSFIMLLTPVMWDPKILTGNRLWLVYLNPIAYYLEVLRAPLLGRVPNVEYYYGIFGIIFVLFLLANYLYTRLSKRIVFWL